ncbi:hypothetical protein OAJ94_05100 [Deltaproteobacteria bacterium]|nr:hypothetical protein [Deltaproteobacteria bacterium]
MSNVKTFLIGFILVAAGGTMFGFMLADESWMVAEHGFENEEYLIYEPGTTIRVERGIYGWGHMIEGGFCLGEGTFSEVEVIQCEDLSGEKTYNYGDNDENNAVLMGCEAEKEDTDGLGVSEDPCDIIAAGDTAHWIFLGGIILASLAIILAFIGIQGYIPGWIISLLMVLAVLTIAIGAVIWLVMYPEINDNIENPDEHFSPSYGFYLTLASTPLLFLGGIAWGGMEAYALGNDDWDEDEEEWRDAMESSHEEDANWRQQQNRPTMVPDSKQFHQQQYQQEMQQYQYQDQGYHNQQSYAQPQRQAPSSPSPTSRPPFRGGPSAPPNTGPPNAGPPNAGPPNAGPPQAVVGPPRSGPSGMGGPPRSGPPAGPSMSPKPKGPPRSESSPRVRKAIAPIPNPRKAVPAQSTTPVAPVAAAPFAPVAHQPAPPVAAAPVAPVAHQPAPPVAAAPVAPVPPAAYQPVAPVAAAPVAPVPQPAASLTAYVAPVMPTAPQQSAVPLMSQSGTVRADGWEILEWPQGSGKWFWKDRNSGRWTVWK